ncbi:hypothetical protein SAMD00019534_038620 [Acytostelium subglobosum LB1]|uniref:hypothetical protein n=1 Tax=Acytostelium subglobosum LB1 TaxID=1410327 RepID=UPI000644C049|nr:hypothetical protein SAMD00019534_038620 [Acytostelium subglobosum LB1]GAM20687.1 hypothetical protein SAMD00019534_038620 [Acytostelium subglobosum LB1]|eukprot:XP_012760208.1 hypothetical protein SAMD00019534_038620 [Acytostelium subglobosum LB1]
MAGKKGKKKKQQQHQQLQFNELNNESPLSSSSTTTTTSLQQQQHNESVNLLSNLTLFPHLHKRRETHSYIDKFEFNKSTGVKCSSAFYLHGQPWSIVLRSPLPQDPDVLHAYHDKHISIFLVAVETKPLSARIDFSIDIRPNNSKSNASRSSAFSQYATKYTSFEITSQCAYTGFQNFIRLGDYNDMSALSDSFVITINMDAVVDNDSMFGKRSYLESVICKASSLLQIEHNIYVSLMLSFYFMPILRRAMLELPRTTTNVWAMELQRIIYQLSKDRPVVDNRFAQAINFFSYFYMTPSPPLTETHKEYEFDTILQKTLAQAISCSLPQQQTKLKYYLCFGNNDETESVYTINLDNKVISGDMVTLLRNSNSQLRLIDLFPSVLFVSLPRLFIDENNKTTEESTTASPGFIPYENLRRAEIDFPEDFYYDQVLQPDEDIDQRSSENHYVLYSVWMHEHPEDDYQGTYYTFLRPLDQPHWIKVKGDCVEEVSFKYVSKMGIGPGTDRFPYGVDMVTLNGRISRNYSYAYMLVYVLESEMRNVFNEEDNKFTVDLDHILSNEKDKPYFNSDIKELLNPLSNEQHSPSVKQSQTSSSSTLKATPSPPPKAPASSPSGKPSQTSSSSSPSPLKATPSPPPKAADASPLLSSLVPQQSGSRASKKKRSSGGGGGGGCDINEELFRGTPLSKLLFPIAQLDQETLMKIHRRSDNDSDDGTSENDDFDEAMMQHLTDATQNWLTGGAGGDHDTDDSALNHKLMEWQSQLARMQKQFEDKVNELEMTLSESRQITKQMDLTKKELEQSQRAMELTKKEMDTLSKSLEIIAKEKEEMKKQNEQLSEKHKKASNLNDIQRKELDTQRSQLAQYTKQSESFKNSMAKISQTNMELEKEVETLRQTVKEECELREREQSETGTLRKQLSELQLENRRLLGDQTALSAMDMNQLVNLSQLVGKSLYTINEQLLLLLSTSSHLICSCNRLKIHSTLPMTYYLYFMYIYVQIHQQQ